MRFSKWAEGQIEGIEKKKVILVYQVYDKFANNVAVAYWTDF